MKIDRTQDKGVTYLNFRHNKSIVGTCCVGDKRFILKGMPKICVTKDSYKFDKELQFLIWCDKGQAKVEARNPTKYDCLEFIFELKDGLEFLKECRAVLDDIEKTIKGDQIK